jgi:hypothetical protein
MTLPYKNSVNTAVYPYIPISGRTAAQEPSTYFTTQQHVINSFKKKSETRLKETKTTVRKSSEQKANFQLDDSNVHPNDSLRLNFKGKSLVPQNSNTRVFPGGFKRTVFTACLGFIISVQYSSL